MNNFLFKKLPKEGDRVKTTVGFGLDVKGVVTKVFETHCWIKVEWSNSVCYPEVCASFSYCNFKYL